MAYKTRKKRRSSKTSTSYSVKSGTRTVARTRKLATARVRAEGLLRRGSKHVSIHRGGKSFPLTATRRRRSSKAKGARRVTARRISRRRSTHRRSTRRRSSKRRVSKNKRRSSRRRVSRRRSSRRRSSRR